MRKVKSATAKSYLTALRSRHIQLGYQTDALDDERIDLVIRGGNRFYGEREKRLRLPITAPILRRIVDKIRNSDHDSINLKAALCVAFAGFLRSGEFTWDTLSGFYLARRDVVFNSSNSVTLTLPSSKTDPFHRGVSIILAGCPSSPICPVRSLRALFTLFPRNPSNPLFSRTLGPFNRQYLVEKIKEMLLRAAIPSAGFSGHSLRKGAAVSAAANGLSRDEIKLLGRWKSDAVDVYINEVSQVDKIQNMLQLNSKLHYFPPPTISSLASAM
jgi:integrase